ncbi:hypothetical protein ACFXKR_40850 [Streptomyces violascens]|uniref:hypothetical protein n=1 Tax=Streptomyces violascens TaxID=67381 RepID=UPI00367B6ACA
MTGRKEAHERIQACGVQAALALAQEFFGFTTEDGRLGVPLDQAHVFAARRVDLWEGWEEQPRSVHGLCGRLWRVLREEGSLTQREAITIGCLLVRGWRLRHPRGQAATSWQAARVTPLPAEAGLPRWALAVVAITFC